MEGWVLDKDFRRVSYVEGYSSFIWTERVDSPGDFELYFPLERADASLINTYPHDFYIQLEGSDYIMIIEDHNIETDEEEGNFLTVTGRSFESVLDRRIVQPQMVLSTTLQGALQMLANMHITFEATTAREISNLRFEWNSASELTSMFVNAQYTGAYLSDVFHDLCVSHQIGFRCRWDGLWMNLEIFPGGDFSETRPNPSDPFVIFSPKYDNLLASEYASTKREFKSVAYVAGEGEGNERLWAQTGDTTSTGMDRRELYVDARDLSSKADTGTITLETYLNLLRQRGNEKLGENIVLGAMSGEAETSFMYKYGTDFNLGDIVQLENEYGYSGRARVSEYVRTHDSSGLRAYPTFVAIE